MIQDEQEYQHTKKQLSFLKDGLAQLNATPKPDNIGSAVWNAQKNSIVHLIHQIETELDAYQKHILGLGVSNADVPVRV